MGKTKTAFVQGTEEAEKKPSYDKAAKEAKRAAKSKAEAASGKVHLTGLKGGQRIKMVEAPSLVETTEGAEKTLNSEANPKKEKVRSKKYLESKTRVDKTKFYSLNEAIKLTKDSSYSRFDGSVELHLVVKKTGLSFNVTLPYSSGKQKKIEVADDTTVKKLADNKIDFDILLATVDMMPKLIPFAKILGPKGLMPNPKNGTLIKNKSEAKNFSADVLTLKTEKDASIIHTVVGKVSQKDEQLVQNTQAILDGVGKGQLLKAFIKATMGPSIKIAI